MKSRFERKSDRINKKKYAITKNVMNSLCNKRSRLSPDKLEKKLEKYGNAMINLEKKKYNLRTSVILKETNDPECLGYIELPDLVEFKPNQEKRGPLKPTISINYNYIIPALKSKSKEDRVYGIISYMSTIHHEMRHLEQYTATQRLDNIENISGAEALKYAKEFVALDFAGKKYYEEKDNYRKHFTEKDARESEFTSVIDIFKQKARKNPYIRNYLFSDIDSTFNDAFVETENLDFIGKNDDRDTITNDLINHAVAKYPNLLKKYPILQKEYNKDGSRKEVYQIIKDNAKSCFYINHNPFYSKDKRKEKLQQTKDMYSSIFIASKDTLTEKKIIKTQKMVGKQAVGSMLSQSKKYLENNKESLKDFAKVEEKIRKFLGDSPTNAQLVRQERDRVIQNKYDYDIEGLENDIKFYQNGGFKGGMASLPNRVRQERKDKARVEKNYNLKMTGTTPHRMRQKEPARSLNLNEMKDLSLGYKKLKETSKNSLEMYKKEYEDLMQEKDLNSEEQSRT